MKGLVRMKKGFHRLGLVGLLPFFIAGVFVDVTLYNNKSSDFGWGMAIIGIGVLWYALCRGTAWVIDGFSKP
jgi:hypothetical protein